MITSIFGIAVRNRRSVGPILAATVWVAVSAWSMGMPSERATRDAFAQRPAIAHTNGHTLIDFALASPGVATVQIQNEAGQIVRHLASGVLGDNAPDPFAPNTLRQTLIWDGKNDAGEPAPPGRYTAVVGLGLQASYDRSIGEQPGWYGNIHAMAADNKGKLYLVADEGGYMAPNAGIIVLDRDGNYQRQIAPPPHTMPIEKLAGLDPVRLPDGSVWFRRGLDLPGGHIRLDLPSGNIGSMAVSSRNELLIPGPPGGARTLLRMGTDGSVPAGAFDTRLTKLPDAGYLSVAVCPDGKTLYMAGAEAGYLGHDARTVVYRHAVYRLRLDSPGPPEIFTGDDENRGGPGFSVNRPRGLATDAQGNVYVCNYGGGNIAVYTPGAGLIRSIQVEHPQQAAVHPETGRLYVLAGKELGWRRGIRDNAPTMEEARLMRFCPDGTLEQQMELEHAFLRMETTWRPGPSYRLSMTADFSGERPVVWMGVSHPDARHARWRLLRIEDEGDAFGEHREICPIPEQGVSPEPLQLLLDPERDMLYINNWNRLLRYSGDGKNIAPVPLFSADGEERYYVVETALGPDNSLYALTWGEGRWGGENRTRVRRFTIEGQQIPFAGGRLETELVIRSVKGASGRSARGMTVDRQGNIYVMHYDRNRPDDSRAPWERGWGYGTAVAVFGPDGEMKNQRHIAYLRAGAQGIRADRNGNLYIGESIMPLGVAYPRDFSAILPDPLERPYPAMTKDGRFDPLLRWQGSIVKFGPDGGEIIGLPEEAVFESPARPAGDLWKPMPEIHWHLHNNHKLRVLGARWMRHGVFSPVPAQYQGVTHAERCVCNGGRFDIDEFDRIVVPDRIRQRIAMLDTAGNVMGQWGKPGNRDSISNKDTLFLTDPWWIAAAADRIYIGEKNPVRIQRWTLQHVVQAASDFELRGR